MKIFKILMAAIILGACAALAIYLSARSDRAVRSLTISVLRNIPQSFLVMESSEQLALATMNDGGWILGPRVGQVSAKRRIYWGVDLSMIASKDIAVDGHQVRIKVPDPSVLDTSLDMSSLQFFTKRSGLQFMRDMAMGRSLECDLLAVVYSSQPEHTPSDIQARRASFVARLNCETANLFESKGLTVVFD